MKNLKVVIAIDDLHPEEGWGMPNDECTKYIQLLNEEFGCKFVLFTPSNYHGLYPLSKHKSWVDFWNNKDWIELAAHGHLHSRPLFSHNFFPESEFMDLNYLEAVSRIKESLNEWHSVGVHPSGWRMCGWNATQGSFNAAEENFEYLAIHEVINKDIHFRLGKKRFSNNTCITAKQVSLINNEFIYFQSHISGASNKNIFNQVNYNFFRNTLLDLHKTCNLQFKTFKELL